MAPEVGMDADAVRSVAGRLESEAARLSSAVAALDSAVSNVQSSWRGRDAEDFVGWWQHQHRPALLKAHEAVIGLARSARNNAADQDQTSLGPAGLSMVDISRVVGFAGVVSGPASAILGGIGDVARMGFFAGAGAVAGAVGYAVDGFGIAKDFAEGRPIDGAVDIALTGGDVAAGWLKSNAAEGGPTAPLWYGGGVALQAWVEAGKAAKQVDFSAKGLHEIQQASLSDWGSGLLYAAKQLPTELISIFSPW